MTTTPSSEPNVIETEATNLLNVISQMNQQGVIAKIHALRSAYGEQILALVLHRTGQRILEAQQAWANMTQGWHFAVQQSGRNAPALGAEIQQIFAADASLQPPSQPA